MKLAIFDDLLTKKMTRKEFLLHSGLLILALTGVSSLVKTLANPNLINKKTRIKQTSSFGAGSYGV